MVLGLGEFDHLQFYPLYLVYTSINIQENILNIFTCSKIKHEPQTNTHQTESYPTTEAIPEKVQILYIEKIERSAQILVCQSMSRLGDDTRISY